MGGDVPELNRRRRLGGADVAWDRFGAPNGTPLVLCHGFSGSAADFALQIPELGSRRPVLTLDQRGHGRSEKLGRLDGYTIDRLALDLLELLDADASGPADFLGHSMGGRVVLEAATRRPDLVRSLILMDTSASAFFPADSPQGGFMTAFLSSYDPAGGLPDMTAMRSPEDDLIEARTPKAHQEARLELQAGFDPYALKALGLDLISLGERPLLEALGQLDVPVTVIVGELDETLVGPSREMADAARSSRLVVIEGAYHSPQLTHSDAWVSAVEGHLANL